MDGPAVIIGSPSDIAVYQELGMPNLPPRSFLGAALFQKLDEVAEVLDTEMARVAFNLPHGVKRDEETR